jgi:tetratricopeptide (TPR) repeat protein
VIRLRLMYLRKRPLILLCLLDLILFGCASAPPGSKAAGTAATAKSAQRSPSDTEKKAYETALKCIQDGKFSEAETTLSGLNSASPFSASALANLALVDFKLQKIDSANTYIAQAIELKPNQHEYENLAGLIAVEKGDFKTAEAHYRNAIAINKQYAYAYYNLALLYDIYYQDINRANENYAQYLLLINHEDKETLAVVEQLKASLNKNQEQR